MPEWLSASFAAEPAVRVEGDRDATLNPLKDNY